MFPYTKGEENVQLPVCLQTLNLPCFMLVYSHFQGREGTQESPDPRRSTGALFLPLDLCRQLPNSVNVAACLSVTCFNVYNSRKLPQQIMRLSFKSPGSFSSIRGPFSLWYINRAANDSVVLSVCLSYLISAVNSSTWRADASSSPQHLIPS